MRRPSRILSLNRYSPTTSHSKRGLVAIEWMIATARTRTIAPATQRPGRRTGTARMSSGRPSPPVSLTADTVQRLALGAVDLRVADRAVLDPPFFEDRLVLAFGHQVLQGFQQRLGEPAALRHRKAVGGEFIGFAHRLELAVVLLDLVVHDRRVGHPALGAAAGDREVDLVLAWEAFRCHGLLNFFGACLALSFRFFLLDRALLGSDRL